LLNHIVLSEVVLSVLDEDAPLPFHQSDAPRISSCVGEHKFLREITCDVLSKRLRDLQRGRRSSSNGALESMAEFSFWYELDLPLFTVLAYPPWFGAQIYFSCSP
jgi:hypothetical protein